LSREAHVNNVARFSALDQAQGTARDEAAHGPAHGVVGETGTASEPEDGKTEAKLSFEAAVTKKMRIDGAVSGGQAQTKREVLELFPDMCGVGFFGFHGLASRAGDLGRKELKRELTIRRKNKELTQRADN
jgi:hypothetical protein